PLFRSRFNNVIYFLSIFIVLHNIYSVSLHDALPIYYEVIIVDNGSKRSLSLNGQFSHYKLIRSKVNLGFAGGNNLAILQAKGDRSEEHTSELQSRFDLVCRLLLEKKSTHLHDITQ